MRVLIPIAVVWRFVVPVATFGREVQAIQGIAGQLADAGNLPVYDRRFLDIGEVRADIYNVGQLSYVEFPKGSSIVNLFAWTAFGCIRGPDTLVTGSSLPSAWQVTSGAERYAYEPIVQLSARRGRPDYTPLARAEQEFYSVSYDTSYLAFEGRDPLDQRPHKPIGLEIHTTARAWSDEYSKRFVLIDTWFLNISGRTIEKACVGVRAVPRVWYIAGWPGINRWDEFRGNDEDENCGFLSTVPAILPGLEDTVYMAWSADNDGDPNTANDAFLTESPTSVIGVRVLRHPEGGRRAFNWWSYYPGTSLIPYINWGPRRLSDHVIYGNSLGWPKGDRAYYHMMINGEIDYDQAYAASDMTARGWNPPNANETLAQDIADGQEISYSLSFGPLPDIAPGDSVPLTVAYVAGADFHRNPRNLIDNLDPLNPKPYLNNLNFSDLITNARWADWVYDNPGIDTDGDGNRGRAYLVNCDDNGCDSVFYRGDGVPDWRGPSAPPPPEVEVTTKPSQVILRWRGNVSETFRDPFSRQRDFEGYRLYLGKFDQDEAYSLVASWDEEDYKRLAFDADTKLWTAISYPLSPGEWPVELDDPDFRVADYAIPSVNDAYRDTVIDTIRNTQGEIVRLQPRERFSYWVQEDYNRTNGYWESDQWVSNIIQRVDEKDTVIEGESLTFGIYEVTLSGLNPSVPLYVAVTAFDFGDFKRDLGPLESSPSTNSAYAEFIYSSNVVIDSNLRVSVFPNPYKISYPDAWGKTTTYYLEGFEGRGVEEFVDQDRRIHFINLPDTATIRIFSLDGDLIREIQHPDQFLTTYSSSVGWDLISRNTQAVVSGIYIWRVDSRLGTQVGKLVIIK